MLKRSPLSAALGATLLMTAGQALALLDDVRPVLGVLREDVAEGAEHRVEVEALEGAAMLRSRLGVRSAVRSPAAASARARVAVGVVGATFRAPALRPATNAAAMTASALPMMAILRMIDLSRAPRSRAPQRRNCRTANS